MQYILHRTIYQVSVIVCSVNWPVIWKWILHPADLMQILWHHLTLAVIWVEKTKDIKMYNYRSLWKHTKFFKSCDTSKSIAKTMHPQSWDALLNQVLTTASRGKREQTLLMVIHWTWQCKALRCPWPINPIVRIQRLYTEKCSLIIFSFLEALTIKIDKNDIVNAIMIVH